MYVYKREDLFFRVLSRTEFRNEGKLIQKLFSAWNQIQNLIEEQRIHFPLDYRHQYTFAYMW